VTGAPRPIGYRRREVNMKPLCFVLMPFGTKKDPGGGPDIDFDAIYEQGIQPAIEDAGMESVRADEERTGGIIHKAMFERLLLCDYAVADLTAANANVYYELGVRHAARPATTLPIFATQQKLLFDVNYLRAMPYELGENNRFTPREAGLLRTALANKLLELRENVAQGVAADSPIFQLLPDYPAPDVAHLKTDVFRDQVHYSAEKKRALGKARRLGDPEEVLRVEESLGSLDAVEAGVLVDLYLSYRAVKAWDRMVNLYERLPAVMQRSVLVREQFGFALNRLGRRQEALDILEKVVEEQGPNSETCGLIGRVYKDLWSEAQKAGDTFGAQGFLDRAIDNYIRGFEADWRDAYPGINAVTLLDIQGDARSQQRKAELLPVVRFAVMQRLKASRPDYWDYATLLELAVLDGDEPASRQRLGDALACIREVWEPETTVNNLKLIREARRARNVEQPWLDAVIDRLANAKPREP
jgi:tetratricopeptide (TPR) repeat protein